VRINKSQGPKPPHAGKNMQEARERESKAEPVESKIDSEKSGASVKRANDKGESA
jgi:hypothetical protein